MATLISKSPEETLTLGEEWGREAQHGWLIGLTGDLGAGKTQLVKGIARGLGSGVRVHSPTFALLNEYGGGRLPLFHLDLYRLNTREEIIGAGLEEYLCNRDGVTVVEWIERWIPELHTTRNEPGTERQTTGNETPPPPPRRNSFMRLVHIETVSETERRITYEDSGA